MGPKNRLAPENTLAAFRAAIELGPDMIELDVTLTRDGEPVVIHDDTLDRTTDGMGPVQAGTLAELRALDAGSWFSEEFAGERIPTLAEVLELVRGKVLLNVEIKEEVVTERIEGGITERVIQLLHELQMAGDVVLSSFEPRALEHARQIDAGIVRASLFNEGLHAGMGPIEVMDAVGARIFSPSKKELTSAIVAECHEHERLVTVYTVNEPDEMRRMIELGLDGLFTDRADVMLAVVRS